MDNSRIKNIDGSGLRPLHHVVGDLCSSLLQRYPSPLVEQDSDMTVDPLFAFIAITSPIIGLSGLLAYSRWRSHRKFAHVKQKARQYVSEAEKRRVLMEKDVIRCNAHLHRIAEILQGSSGDIDGRGETAVVTLHQALERLATATTETAALERDVQTLNEAASLLRDLSYAYELYLKDSASRIGGEVVTS